MKKSLVFLLLGLVFNISLATPLKMASVLAGARLFQSNCSSCHSVKYLQNSKGIPAFPAKKVPEILGVHPPDLSLEIKIHGAHWVYAYLNGFYPDLKRPLGTNNYIYPDTAMPNMLAGWKAQMTPEQFHQALQDIVSFLTYASDPHQNKRKELGCWVIGFLTMFAFVLGCLFYNLKRNFK